MQLLLLFLVHSALGAAPAKRPHLRRPQQPIRHKAANHIGEGLQTFVTRPDIRAPRWNVEKVHPDKITPGYWFVTPQAEESSAVERNEFVPAQVGPHIYDGDGNLVWSGADLDRNRNAYDFRPFEAENETKLSYIYGWDPNLDAIGSDGYGVLMGADYQIYDSIMPLANSSDFNAHELTIHSKGNRALFFASYADKSNVFEDDFDGKARNTMFIKGHFVHDTLVDFDLTTKTVSYQWRPRIHGGVTGLESYDTKKFDHTNGRAFWDFFHADSIALTPEYDYLLSARFTNTIYKISRQTGEIVWRLGGKKSDFKQDFVFSSQHSVSVISEDGPVMVIALLDNAADDKNRQKDTAKVSSGKIISVNADTKVAKLLQTIARPDGKLTRDNGNIQILPTSNYLLCWSEGGYMTEHTSSGSLILSAHFVSPRFSTYRAYKGAFIGRPRHQPIMRAISFTPSSPGGNGDRTIVAYVSWNGATEVKEWRLVGAEHGQWKELARAARDGFETSLATTGSWTQVLVQGIGPQGEILGRSKVQALDEKQGGLSADLVTDDMETITVEAGGAKPLTEDGEEKNEEPISKPGWQNMASKSLGGLRETARSRIDGMSCGRNDFMVVISLFAMLQVVILVGHRLLRRNRYGGHYMRAE